jgi:hypothetical protein
LVGSIDTYGDLDINLDLGDDDALTIPKNLVHPGSLTISGETHRPDPIPTGLRVGQDMRVRCEGIVCLSDDIRVDGWLELRDMSTFTSLGHGLVIRGDLEIDKCPSWDRIIPYDAKISGLISVDGVTVSRVGVTVPESGAGGAQ